MNAILQSQLDRIEAALNVLTDSITSYNPSIVAAQELIAADDEFQKGIDQLTIHQRNHAQLISLRATADTLSESLTTSLTRLAETRTAILSTSAPSLPAASSSTRRPIPHAELLAVARNAARYAAPINFNPPGSGSSSEPAAAGTTPSSNTQPDAGPQSSQSANTQDTIHPDASVSQQPPQPSQTNLPGQPETNASFLTTATATQGSGSNAAAGGSSNPGLSILEESEKLWLDPVTQAPFFPWPSDDMIARSGLAKVQGWVGAAPEMPVEGAEGADQQQQGQEMEGVQGGTGDVGKMEGVEGGAGANGAGGGGGGQVRDQQQSQQQQQQSQSQSQSQPQPPPPQQPREEKPSQFLGLDLYDPDDD